MEYLFKKADLQQLINAATNSNVIAVIIDYECDGTTNKYNAKITAKGAVRNITTGAQTYDAATPVDGCPNPPGCPGTNSNLIMKAMNIL